MFKRSATVHFHAAASLLTIKAEKATGHKNAQVCMKQASFFSLSKGNNENMNLVVSNLAEPKEERILLVFRDEADAKAALKEIELALSGNRSPWSILQNGIRFVLYTLLAALVFLALLVIWRGYSVAGANQLAARQQQANLAATLRNQAVSQATQGSTPAGNLTPQELQLLQAQMANGQGKVTPPAQAPQSYGSGPLESAPTPAPPSTVSPADAVARGLEGNQ